MPPSNLSHLTIRAATNNDCERVSELIFGVLAEYGLEPDRETTDADLEDLEASWLERGGLFEVIEDEQGNLVGSCGLYPLNNTTCELGRCILFRAREAWAWGSLYLSERSSRQKREGVESFV